ncbi:MAG: ATPase domain-containing protein [Candidatus Geothermarchaeales archaeon]
MSERVPTGIERFDDLIEGGFPPGSIVLVAGGPGTGKTILASHFIYNGAEVYGDPGVYVSIAERREEFLRNMSKFGMDFARLEEDGKVRLVDLVAVKPTALEAVMEKIQDEVAGMKAKRLVVDPFTPLSEAPAEKADRIAMQHVFNNILKASACTTLLTAEVPMDARGIGRGIEEFAADGVMTLDYEIGKGEVSRYVTIRKLRGTSHEQGMRSFVIGGRGFEVLPQFRHIPLRLEERERMLTEIAALDVALGGGIPFGAVCLVEVNGIANFRPLYTAILKTAVEKENGLTYVLSSRESPMDVTTVFGKYGIDVDQLRKEQRLDFVDYYQRKMMIDEEETISLAPGKLDATSLLILLKDILERTRRGGRRAWLASNVIDEINLMGVEDYFRFFAQLVSMIRRGTDVYLPYVNSEALEPRHLEMIRTFADVIIQIRVRGGEHILRVAKTPDGSMSTAYRMVFQPEPPYFKLV